MVRPAVLAVGFMWFGLASAYYWYPAKMYRIYHWPLTAKTPVGENVRTTYRRNGLVCFLFGLLFFLWGLVA